ncbi:MAG: hypothetical protein KJ601_03840 [Nanoarchaeota archaeon]|nr:hypothetical protein [Nanoarchaeota archaeon]
MSQISLVVIPNKDYMNKVIRISRQYAAAYSSICYVNMNRTLDSLTTKLQYANIDLQKFMFVDTITRPTNPHFVELPNSIYLDDASSLTHLSAAINKTLSQGAKALIFDSISTLFIYNEIRHVSVFAQNLIGSLRKSGKSAIFTMIEDETKQDVLTGLSRYFDKVIQLKPTPNLAAIPVFFIISYLAAILALYFFDIHWNFYPGGQLFPPEKHVFEDRSIYLWGGAIGAFIGTIFLKII